MQKHNQLSVEIRINENILAKELINIYKQRLSLCHIGLVKEQGGHIFNQPCLLVFDKCLKTTVENKLSTVRKTNTEHGDEKLQMKRACLCTQRSGSSLIEKIWYGQKC